MMQKALIAAGFGLSMSATFLYGVHPIFILLSFFAVMAVGKIGAELYYTWKDKKALPPAQSGEDISAWWGELRAQEHAQKTKQEIAETWVLLKKIEDENDRLKDQRHLDSTSERFLKDENSRLKKRMEERGEIIKVLESANDRWQRRVGYLESSDHHTWPPEYDE